MVRSRWATSQTHYGSRICSAPLRARCQINLHCTRNVAVKYCAILECVIFYWVLIHIVPACLCQMYRVYATRTCIRKARKWVHWYVPISWSLDAGNIMQLMKSHLFKLVHRVANAIESDHQVIDTGCINCWESNSISAKLNWNQLGANVKMNIVCQSAHYPHFWFRCRCV